MTISLTHCRGSDVMQLMAIPTVGRIAASLFIPVSPAQCLFSAVEKWNWKRAGLLDVKGIKA